MGHKPCRCDSSVKSDQAHSNENTSDHVTSSKTGNGCTRSLTHVSRSRSFDEHNTTSNAQVLQQHTMMTCSEMLDVWINEIGPKLVVVDIVRLSTVNQWARRISHTIKHHIGYATTKSISKYRKGFAAWPDLRWELRRSGWNQSGNLATVGRWCNVVSLELKHCEVFDFSFVEPSGMEQFTFADSEVSLALRHSLESMLMSCAKLTSLSLHFCIAEHDDMEWLENVLARFTHLSQLSLYDNFLGKKMRRIFPVLRRMPHITSLNLGGNFVGADSEDTKSVCACILNMHNLSTLNLACNEFGVNGAEFVCEALVNKHHLTHLNLNDSNMGSEAMRHLTHTCLLQMPKLSYLDLRWNDVDNDTKQHVRRLLPHVTKLLM